MPSTRRYLCEDEKDDVRECMLAEKRVSRLIPHKTILSTLSLVLL